MGNEPVRVGSAVVAVLAAALNLVVIVGVWHATPDQVAAANAVVVAVVSLATGAVVRTKVSPVAKV